MSERLKKILKNKKQVINLSVVIWRLQNYVQCDLITLILLIFFKLSLNQCFPFQWNNGQLLSGSGCNWDNVFCCSYLLVEASCSSIRWQPGLVWSYPALRVSTDFRSLSPADDEEKRRIGSDQCWTACTCGPVSTISWNKLIVWVRAKRALSLELCTVI